MYVHFIVWAWPAKSFGSSRTRQLSRIQSERVSNGSAERHVVSAGHSPRHGGSNLSDVSMDLSFPVPNRLSRLRGRKAT